MPVVNEVAISRVAFAELRRLVEAEVSGGDPAKVADATLRPYGAENQWNPNAVDVYELLLDQGLIRGRKAAGAFLFAGVSQHGISFVADYDEEEMLRKRALWRDRRFQLYLSLVTLVLSAFAGWVAGHF